MGALQKADQWESVRENMTVSLAQGEKKIIQTNYSTHAVEDFGNHNPRNFTLLFSGNNLYVAMAYQYEYFYYDSYNTHKKVCIKYIRIF